MTLVNGRFLVGRPTGLHRVARGLVVAARQRGLELEVVAPPGANDALVDRTVWGPSGRLGRHLWEQVALPKIAGNRPILSLINTAPLLARRSVVMIHDLATSEGPQWFQPSMRLYRYLVSTAARRAEMVLTVSESVAGELRTAGVGGRPVEVIRPAIDPSFTPSARSDIDAVLVRHGIAEPFVLHLGWASPRKGAAFLARAHLRARATRPHQLVLVGAPHRTFKTVDLPDAPSIRVLLDVDDSDLRALMSATSLFAFPSLYEGFGLPPLEAMACGAPVAVSDIPPLRESTDGTAGRYLDPTDEAAWTEAIVAALCGDLAPSSPPSWTWSDAADQLAGALERLG